MVGRDKDITPNDVGLWDLAMQDVTPLVGRDSMADLKPLPPKIRVKNRASAPVMASPYLPSQARDLDKSTQKKLSRGEMQIEAVLDLHGYTQDDAYAALNPFILQAYHAGLRCVLVITGKGRDGAGVLKSRLQDWLDSPLLRPVVLQVKPAQAKHGGGGAFYVLIRRARS
jgi:DNA-nicking Smr family endonuclease